MRPCESASQGGDGALPVPVQEAYVHARVPDDAGWYGSSRYRIRPCCLLLPRRHRHPGLHCFRRSQPGLHTPLSTLRVTPRGATRMTRGRCGSLPLHRSGLSPPTSCRSPGAHRGRNADCSTPPAQIRAGPTKALGSYLECMTRNRWSGHGCCTRTGGKNRSMSRLIRAHVSRCRWLRRRRLRNHCSLMWARNDDSM